MIDMKRLIRKCNADTNGTPHLVQVGGQWLCMGDGFVGADEDRRMAYDKRQALLLSAAHEEMRLERARQPSRALITQEQAQQTQQFQAALHELDSVDLRKLTPWQHPQRGRQV